ncbi:MAG: hypothetical protein H6728_16660 [Myxococcales bacterium]|nr:hypothetical protein [Myxococcales bacterium]
MYPTSSCDGVGGFPQVDLFRAWGPKLRERLWMVGDSIFPGQSTAAVALGGLRVAEDIVRCFGGAEKPVADLDSSSSMRMVG